MSFEFNPDAAKYQGLFWRCFVEEEIRPEYQELCWRLLITVAQVPEDVLVEAFEKVMPGSSSLIESGEDQKLLDWFGAFTEDEAFRALDRIITVSVQRVTSVPSDSTVLKFAPDSAFGLYTDRVLELANATFSPMYTRIFEECWDNSMDARMTRNYCITKWSEGIYEVYVPTFARVDGGNLGFWRIIIKVLPEIDTQAAHEQGIDCFEQHIKPAGVVDSELICLVAPRKSARAWRRKEKLIRGFKQEPKPGYLTGVFIGPPEICMLRIGKVIANFLKKRIKALLEKLNLEPWQYDYKGHEHLYYTNICNVIESFSYLIATSLRCLSHSLNWILMKMRGLKQEIGRQNMLKMAISKVFELKTLLQGVKLENPQILGDLEAVLVKATESKFSQTFVKKQGKFKPPTQNGAEESGQPRGDASTFLERLHDAERLGELPDRGKVSWPNG